MDFLPLSMIVGKVSKKGQVVIPKIIRDNLKLNYGDAVSFTLNGKNIIVNKIEESLIDVLEASIPFPKNAVEFQKDLRGEWD